MDTPLQRVIATIRERHPAQRGREQAWLAEALGSHVQVVSNWSRRGLPRARYNAIAKLLGMTIGQIAGTEDLQPAMPNWPLDGFISRKRWAAARPEHRAAAAHAAMLALDALEARSDL